MKTYGGSTWGTCSINAATLYLDPVTRPGDDWGHHGASSKIGAETRPAAGDDTPAAAGHSLAATVQRRAVLVRRGRGRAQPAAGERGRWRPSPAPRCHATQRKDDERRRRGRCRRRAAIGPTADALSSQRRPRTMPARRTRTRSQRRRRRRRRWASLRQRTSNAFGGEESNLEDFVAAGRSLADHLTEQLHVADHRSGRAADRRPPHPHGRRGRLPARRPRRPGRQARRSGRR